jgi:sugar phosphate isomerase/epimerase
MLTGVSTASFFGKEYTENTLEHIARMGAPVCEVFLDTYCEYEPEFALLLKERTEECGLKVQSVHAMSTQFEPQLFSMNERQRSDARGMLEKVFKSARTLGAGAYVFHGPPAFQRTLRLVHDYAHMGAIVSPLCDMAAEYGLKFTWENVFWCAYRHTQFAHRLLEHVKSDNLWFTLDIKQAVLSGHAPEGYIEDMGERIANVHLCDYATDADGKIKTCLPGEGELDMRLLRERLERFGFAGAVILEVYSSNYKTYQELGACYARLREIFE